jgi:UDPglucose--hexose-1-phosphate uridylyltransferase
MPELRKDPIVGRWVIISTDRARRPDEYKHDTVPLRSASFCPFCPGHEDKTPHEVLAYREPGSKPNGPGWKLRVVPNKYPALKIEGEIDRQGEGLYDKMNGVGAHEVVIETDAHEPQMSELDETQIERVLMAYRERIIDLRNDSRFKYVMVFKNQGAAAGASLEHTHSQLIALPVVPRAVGEEMAGARKHYEYKERCIYCDIVKQELSDGRRVIYKNDHFLVISPFAPKQPFETWIIPRVHGAHYEDTPRPHFAPLANALRQALRKLGVALDRPAWNYMLHTAPFRDQEPAHFYHWHFEIMPTLTKVAGFEWGSGFYINPTPPEEAAAFLRELDT